MMERSRAYVNPESCLAGAAPRQRQATQTDFSGQACTPAGLAGESLGLFLFFPLRTVLSVLTTSGVITGLTPSLVLIPG